MTKQVLCYECGRKLYQNKIHTKLINLEDPGFIRKFHKVCAEELLRREPTFWRKPNEGY